MQQRRKNSPPTPILPPPQALHARLPEIKLLCSFRLAASCPLDSQTLLLAREPGERPAEGTPQDSQGHSIGEGPGLLRAHGAQRLRASAQDHSTRAGRSRDVRDSGGTGGGGGGFRRREVGPRGRQPHLHPLTVSLCLPAGLTSTIARPR